MEDNRIYILGSTIYKRRRELGFSQNVLAEKLDISREHLAKIETAKRTPSLELLIKISDFLQIKLKDLINF